jgi:hypothetical protein
MAFGKVTKEELKEIGLDADAIAGMKTTLDGLDDKIKNAATEANKATATSLEELKGQLATLGNKLQSLTLPNKDGNNGGGNGNGESHEEVPDWLLDPEKATKDYVTKQIGGVATLAATMRADMNYTTFKSTNPRAFGKYETEIKAIWDKEPIQNKLNPKLIENIYKIVIADHVDEIAKQGETFFLEPSGGGKPHSDTGPKKKPEDILTKDELELATKWGISAEDYLKEKSGITGVTYA